MRSFFSDNDEPFDSRILIQRSEPKKHHKSMALYGVFVLVLTFDVLKEHLYPI